ncbi:cornulin [Sigmodon hispidus]
MPQLLQNIHGIIEAFRCYARSEGGCKVLTRGELKRLLEHEFAEVIVNPHDPKTVDEVLYLLDEDNTGTVEFKEFLVLVFKVARTCFKTLSEGPRGTCTSGKPESCIPGSSREPEKSQRGGTGEGRDVAEQRYEDSSCGQRDQASKEWVRVETHTQSQDSYPTQVSSHETEAESQRQGMVSQQTQMTGQEEQTQRTEDKNWTRERSSDRQSQVSQQTREAAARATTQAQAGDFQTQGSTCGQNRGVNSHSQGRNQADQAAAQYYQTPTESPTQINPQMVEQGWRQQTGSSSIQTWRPIYDQNRETEAHGQVRNQAGQAAKEHHQAQAETYTQTHAQTMEQGGSQQARNSSIQTKGSVYDQNRRTEIHEQDSGHAGQVGRGHYQTQVGLFSQTLEHDRSQSSSQLGATEKTQTHTQSGMEQEWTAVSNYETREQVLRGQDQTEKSTVEERQDCGSNYPGPKGGQRERVPTVIRDEWVNDHTREVVIQSQDPGSLHSHVPSA